MEQSLDADSRWMRKDTLKLLENDTARRASPCGFVDGNVEPLRFVGVMSMPRYGPDQAAGGEAGGSGG